ncbi:MAG: RNA polymerase sigma factor [Chitinivibrionales bacterium]
MDKKHFRELYDHSAKRVYNFVLWMVHNREVCEDIVQTAFIRAWQSEAPRNLDEAESWLLRISRNLCIDFFRKRSRSTQFRLRYKNEIPQYSSARQESRFIWEMLGQLKEEERSILILHLRMGFGYKEVADIIGSSESAVRVRAFRSLKKLRKCLSKESI